MYKLKHLLSQSPNVIAAAIFATVNFVAGCVFLAMNVEPTPEFAGLMLQGETALVLALNLFVVQPNTVTVSQANASSAQAAAEKETEIHQFLTEAEPPKAKR